MGSFVLVVVGCLLLAAGVHQWKVARIPPGWTAVPGRVVDVESRKSSLSGNNRRLHGPTVEYRDSGTGETRRLPPASYQPSEYHLGQEVTLRQDPASGQVRLPLPMPVRQLALPFGFGAVVVAMGLYGLVG